MLAQYATDSIALNLDLTKWYDNQVGLQNTVLQQGELVQLTRKSKNSHAYYESDTWTKANITYCNQTFMDIPALYNIEEDILIIQNNLGLSFSAFPLKLNREEVSHFEMGTTSFEYIQEDVGWYEGGYFKIVYKGKSITLLSKVFKKLEIKYGNLSYIQDHHYFLKKENEYYRLKRLSGLIKLFPDHKKEIRQYKKKLSLHGFNNPANQDKLGRLVEYSDKLTQ